MATVTVSFTVTDVEATRILADLGKVRNLVDGNGIARSATAAEFKQFVIDQVKGIVAQAEMPALQATALSSVVLTNVAPQ